MIPKFRAWHKQLKFMGIVGNLWLDRSSAGIYRVDPDQEITVNLNMLELMQWTGCKDGHGQDVYSGDILANNHPVMCTVIIKCLNNILVAWWDDYDILGMHDVAWEDLVVIGNIWENPELLEQK